MSSKRVQRLMTYLTESRTRLISEAADQNTFHQRLFFWFSVYSAAGWMGRSCLYNHVQSNTSTGANETHLHTNNRGLSRIRMSETPRIADSDEAAAATTLSVLKHWKPLDCGTFQHNAVAQMTGLYDKIWASTAVPTQGALFGSFNRPALRVLQITATPPSHFLCY